MVDEAGMDVLSGNEFRNQALVFGKDGLQPVHLGFLFTEYENLVSIFNILSDVCGKYLEILVENRLGRDVEFNYIIVVNFERDIQEYLFERIQFLEKFLFPVHIRRIRPNDSLLWKYTRNAYSGSWIILRNQVGKNLYFLPFLLRELGVAVEYVDAFNLIPEERQPIGIVERI